MDKNAKPLAGKRVVVTRAPHQAASFTSALEERGAEVLHLPTVAFEPASDSAALDDAIHNLEGFDWLLFTSQNTVRFFCERLRILRGTVSGHFPRVAVVGPATAAAAEKEHLTVSRVASVHSGAGLASEFGAGHRGAKVLVPKSDRAGDDLSAALRAGGVIVTEVIAYRTARPRMLDPAVLDMVLQGRADVIAFASPSAFVNLVDTIGSDSLRRINGVTALAAIGGTTAAAIRELGFLPAIVATRSSAQGLADAIVRYCAEQASSGASRK